MFSIEFPKKIELVLWACVPACIAVFLFLLSVISKHLWGISIAVQLLPLAPIFYWGRARNNEISYLFVFVLAVITDSVNGAAFISPLLYLMFLLAVHKRSISLQKEGFMFVWFNFTVMLFALCALQFSALSLYENKALSPFLALLQFAVAAGLYPLLHTVFDFISLNRAIRTHRL